MKKLLVLLAVLAFAMNAFGATIVSDSFGTNTTLAISATAGGTSNGTVQPGVPGLNISRQIIVQQLTGPQWIDSEVSSPNYIVSAGFNTTGIGTIIYRNTAGTWDLNLLSLSATVDAGSNVIAGTTLQFFIRSGANESVSGLLPLVAGGSLSALASSMSGTASLGSIDAVGFYSNLAANADIGYTNFGVGVPEPGTYALMGAGLAALAMLRRRK